MAFAMACGLALERAAVTTGRVTSLLATMLWVSLSTLASGGAAGQAAPAASYGGPDKGDAADEGPTAAEIDVALGSGRRASATDRVGLILPVLGISARQLVDTFGAARSRGRSHGALDIMAPRGSPVVAAADGIVEKLHRSRAGGITVYVRSVDGRWVYYYAHLESYAPGLAVGQHLRHGDPIGRVGSTGNANAAWPHLHFAIYRMSPGARWYQGRPVNPYPLLAGNASRR
jgi:murein DD-endopeptidase MepM/ murein hydrolase activator NlpD